MERDYLRFGKKRDDEERGKESRMRKGSDGEKERAYN